MKACLILLLLISCAECAGQPLPNFSAKLDPLTDLSLIATVRTGQVMRMPPELSVYGKPARARKIVSRMPLIKATGSAARTMRVAKPNPAVNYHTATKEPEVLSEK